MATITTDTFLDGGVARTAGEAWTLNGGKLTIRTDTRWHANAPASMTGSLAATIISATLGGGVFVEGRNVRWMAYNTGTGNVPAIGTTVTQGGVSGYLLGVWASLTSAPTAVAAAMPASGFIKFREVTGGPFAAGALTGIGASATGADVTGWIEYVQDQATAITISRKGTGHVARGDWFYLDNTTGVQGQVLQVPTNGGGANTYCPGVWIETAAASGVYDFWPELASASANGWAAGHIGQAVPDARHKFVKGIGSGQLQIGEVINTAITSYTGIAAASTYTWANSIVTVTLSAHGLSVGEQIYIDATSGTLPDGTYTVETVTAASTFTIYLAGAGTAGNCNVHGRCTIALTAHGLVVGQIVKLTPSTGSLVTGNYEIISSADANSYVIAVAGIVGTGAATQQMNLGLVPPSGCKVRIGNILMRQCTTGARATNARPHATIGSRPVFTTTGAGVVDHENVMSDWQYVFVQPYYIRLKNFATYDVVSITEGATAFEINNGGLGMNQSLDFVSLAFVSCFAGGTVTDFKALRGNVPGTNDHAATLSLCAGQTFTNVTAGLIQYRTSGQSFSLSQCKDLTFTNCRQINANGTVMTTCTNVNMTNHDHVDRMSGVTTTGGATYAFALVSKCNGIKIDGLTVGFGGTIPRQHPYSGGISVTACDNVTFRNWGSDAAPIGDAKRINATGIVYLSGGNNSGIKIQRCFLQAARTGVLTDSNTDKNVTYESLRVPVLSTGLPFTQLIAALNATVRGVRLGVPSLAANASVYGTHMADLMSYNVRGVATYTWVANVLLVTLAGHGYAAGDKIWVEFSTGGGTPSGLYTIYTTTTNNFSIQLTGSGTAGSCNVYRWANSLANLFTSQGRIYLPMNEPTSETLAYAAITGTAAFTSVPSLTIPAVNDEVVFESQHTIKGHTSFLKSQAVMTGIPAVAAASTTYVHAAGVLTVTLAAHGLLVGDWVYLDASSGTLPDGLYQIATVPGTGSYTINLAGSSTSGSAFQSRFLWVRYKIDTGSGYGVSWRNVYHQQAGGTATAGTAVLTMISTADVLAGDYVYGQGLGVEAKVLTVDSATQVTVNVNTIVTGANLTFTFSNLPNEVISSSTGFKLKLSVTSRSPGSTMVVTYVTIPTVTSAADQALALYPLDTTTITFTGLPTGTDVVVLTAGTETVLSQVDAWPGTSYPYTYEGSPTVDVGFIKPGFVPQYIRNLPLTLLAASIPVTLTADRNYS